jgi:hypothetical protein
MKQEKRTVVVTTLRLSVPLWRALRGLAEEQAIRVGGRASTSGVIARLIVEATQRNAERAHRGASSPEAA